MDEQKMVVDPESSNPVVVSRSEYRGEMRLDVRRWYYAPDSELKPTRKGVSLPLSEGLAEAALKAMRTAQGDPVVVGESRRYPVVVQYREYRGRSMLDVRCHYDDGGEFRPTRKGVSLPVDTGLHERVVAAIAKMLPEQKVPTGA